ncbi:hypothetical protein C8R47DRAFT_494888 [Mycena vitilis]|nr:hypothetical protein C8R47DRAFT_494888 [Mycena vitilis]
MKGSISVFSLVAVLAVSSCVFAVKQTFTVTDNCTAGCTTGAPPTPAAESTHSGRPEGGDVSFMNIFNDPLSATDVCCPVDRDLDCACLLDLARRMLDHFIYRSLLRPRCSRRTRDHRFS